MQLSRYDREHFMRDGFVKAEGVVSRALVDRARRAIHASIGREGLDPAKLTQYSAQSYCPEIRKTPVITDLFNASPARSMAEALIGPGRLREVNSAQVALRFPQAEDVERKARPHIDGIHSPTNGVPRGEIASFTMLVSVLLSDIPGPWRGNFTVWPGTHKLYEAYLREHGHEIMYESTPPIDLPEPHQTTGKPGDVIFAHYLLGHGVATNVSPEVRYAVFFRLQHVDHQQHKWEALKDVWLEFEGIRGGLSDET